MGCCSSIDVVDNDKPVVKKPSTMEKRNTAEDADNASVDQSGKPVVPKLNLNKVQSGGEPHSVADKQKNNNQKAAVQDQTKADGSSIAKSSSINNNEDKVNQAQKKTTSTNNFELNVKPDIFVSLKKGHINDYYKAGEILGEGAYGKVYQVQHRTTGIIRAMKAIKKKAVVKEEEEKLFAEVSLLKGLDHPNIVKLYELYQDENNYYLITEYCTGGELFDKIQQMRSFTEKMAADYMRQILSAVVYCHDKKIVHRDLKPENLLLDSKRAEANLKVIDFGTSKKFVAGQKMTQKFGTAYYIAPEVLRKNYDEKCDVWSCGVILYILLCGYPPFGGQTDEEIIKKVKHGKFKFDPEDWAGISQEAKDLIRKMLTYDPQKRIDAKTALNDVWIQKNAKNNPVDSKALANLQQFRSKNKLKQAILTFMASQMTSQQERDELQKTFASLDKDGNGVLTKEELIEGYKLMGREDAEAKVDKIIKQVDIDNSGQIDFTEFIIAAMNREKFITKQRLDQAFKVFDIDGDGFITKEELSNVLGGIEMDDQAWENLVGEVDSNKDGKISREEFFELLTKMI